MKSERTKVLLADDHTIVREGILSLLQAHQEIVVVGTAENGQEAIEKARRELGYRPTVPLLEGVRRAAAWYREQWKLTTASVH